MSFPVAVTGVGLVSPFGSTPLALWEALASAPDARAPWPWPTAAAYPFDQAIPLPREGGRASRWAAHALATRAMAQALASPGAPPRDARLGCLLGTTTAGIDALEACVLDGASQADADGLLEATAILGNGPFTAGASVLCAACASGLIAPALAADRLALGEADVMLAGGVDVLLEYTLGGFSGLRLTGDGPCLPFGRERQAVVLSEGAVVFRLESLRQARDRQAQVLGVIVGAAFDCDAGHMTAPDASGIARAMQGALDDAQVRPGAIGSVFAHGTGTATNDAVEAVALAQVFGCDRIPPVAAPKAVLGHSQGAAGAFSLLAALLALRRGRLPPVRHAHAADPALAGISLARADHAAGSLALVNAFGFGGNNCVMVVASGEGAPWNR